MLFFGMISTGASLDYTYNALRTFYTNTNLPIEYKFFLIDNDGSLNAVELSNYPHLGIIRNQAPLGFAANVNQVAKLALKASADLFFLNNDLAFSRDWILPLLKSEPSILSPISNRELQLNTDIFSTGVVMNLDHYTGNEDKFERVVAEYSRVSDKFLKVLVLPFFCVKLPYQVIEKVGLMDEKFGHGGGEDYDYCIRAHLAGFDVKYAMNSYILHFGGKSSYDGVESKSEQLSREHHFKRVFFDKWGEKLFKLAFNDQNDFVATDPELSRLVAEKEYGELVRRVLELR